MTPDPDWAEGARQEHQSQHEYFATRTAIQSAPRRIHNLLQLHHARCYYSRGGCRRRSQLFLTRSNCSIFLRRICLAFPGHPDVEPLRHTATTSPFGWRPHAKLVMSRDEVGISLPIQPQAERIRQLRRSEWANLVGSTRAAIDRYRPLRDGAEGRVTKLNPALGDLRPEAGINRGQPSEESLADKPIAGAVAEALRSQVRLPRSARRSCRCVDDRGGHSYAHNADSRTRSIVARSRCGKRHYHLPRSTPALIDLLHDRPRVCVAVTSVRWRAHAARGLRWEKLPTTSEKSPACPQDCERLDKLNARSVDSPKSRRVRIAQPLSLGQVTYQRRL